ncbi:ABC transporter permease [Methylomonas sp. LL1]|uniref:ABC transporter permease n=1 Tax=Methylomonas sp. LL1 TaxID=2785785 RepID=UPI0018C43532|nr:ABC transporter permease [Methylomonas sp. LL1]QPK65307.1 ABC transporter permease [Methylomonas sp. LL1]
MLKVSNNIFAYRELIAALAWKNIVIRYKQAYLGILWAVLKPIMLMLVFTLVKGFVGIETSGLPYPLITFAALIPWVFFQESVSEGVNSVTTNAALIKKIYFPREVFPLTAMVTKLVELTISFAILAGMMVYYRVIPSIYALWLPAFILYTMVVALTISFFGAAMNVYYRDIGQAIPIALSLLMYGSPVIYPLSLVQKKLLVEQAAGEWSDRLYTLYTINPLVGIIDGFQAVLIKAIPPDFNALYPGLILTLSILPFSYWFFKRAESWFADVI